MTGFATGAWRLANRCCRRGRITILTLHCVGFPEGTGHLPPYMKLAEADFDALLGRLRRSFEMISLKEAVRRLDAREGGANAVVITLDDGYLDNRTHALPILERHQVPATIFLEAGALDRRGMSWIHKFFFVDRQKGSGFFAAEYARRTEDAALARRITQAASFEGNVEYAIKKVLKYEADRVERDRISHDIFESLGGNEEKILEGAYLSWDDVKSMADRGVSFGCHTMSHPILSTLTKEEARLEILEARKLIESKGGVEVDTFAYPWGRGWDFNEETVQVLKEEGFVCGLAMDERSALPDRHDLYNLSRYPLAEGLSTADILAEASGLHGLFFGD
jgi:peptidoglycan/xylan/chitin deacetylase (PgdA/CDA1 family)